jgi:hypothetical protein
MTGRPQPERRYLDEPEQRAYEQGWHQMYDHDSFRTLDWIEVAIGDIADQAERCRRRAAMLEGAADALLELADRQHDSAVLWEPPA